MGWHIHVAGSTDHQGWHSGQGWAAGGFSELAVAVVMVMVMSLVVVAVVFVVSVEWSRGVVDDEGRAGACANRGDDGSWRGDVGG